MSKFDSTTHNELLVAIQHFLAQGLCQEAAEVLKNEIEKNQLLPVRYDYKGQVHQRSFEEYEKLISSSNVTMVSIIERLSSLISTAVPIPLQNLPLRIFTSKRHALDRKPEDLARKSTLRIAVGRGNTASLKKLDSVRTLFARELGRSVTPKQLLHKSSMNNLELHYRILGHLSSVFCVAFDKSGSYAITGADDNLVKVWNVRKGLLRFTLRGHSAEISDMTISEDNTLLATGSVDKTVRVWCLQTAAPLGYFRTHSAMVTLIAFLPFVDETTRYLVSAGGDCLVNFYRYNSEDRQFEGTPTRFYERTSTGARIVSSCYSPGGSMVVFGDTHHNLRIYRITRDSVLKISDIEAHTDRVDSLAWAHRGLRFASGSRDGVAKVWKFEFNDWTALVLQPKEREEKVSSRNAYKVTMLCWSLEDDFVVTAGSDYILRVWSSTSGEELRQLEGHKEDAYVLHTHPVFENYVLSAGHDGFLMVWDVYTGAVVKRHQNHIEGSGYGAVFDFAISPDGTLVATVDSHGHISVLGVGTNQMAKTTPKEQFFHTDYMPLIEDENNYLVDEETEIAPHLMGPPRMVDGDGIDYDDDIQTLVPGRDLLRDDSLLLNTPPWLTRQMVPTLPKSTVKIRDMYLTELRQMEEDTLTREMKRTRPRGNLVSEKKNNAINTVSRRRRTGVRWSECFPQRQRRLRNQPVEVMDIDEDVSEGSTADSSFSSASATDEELSTEDTVSEDDSSDSDYVVSTRRNANQRRRIAPLQNQRQRRGLPSQNQHQRRVPSLQNQRQRRGLSLQNQRRRRVPSSENQSQRRGSSLQGQRPRRASLLQNQRRRRIEVEPEEDAVAQSSSSIASPTGTSRRRRRRIVVSDEVEDESPVVEALTTKCEPSPSSVLKIEHEDSEPGPSNSRPTSSTIKALRSSVDNTSGISTPYSPSEHHVSSAFLDSYDTNVADFPRWMRLTQPLRFPYVAQIGDEVVYFRQGHEFYLNAVETKGLYHVTHRLRPLAQLDAEEFCIVEEVKYVRKPYRLTAVKLAQTNNNGNRTGLIFSVKFHDMENVPDFIILRHLYDESVARRYQPGTRIETILDNHWWTGTIDKKEVHDEENYPTSNWYCLTVRWDTGEDEKMSPWDVQPQQPHRRSGIASEEDQVIFSQYPVNERDWIGAVQGISECSKRLIDAVRIIEDDPDIKPFAVPVSLVEYPDYLWDVDYPIDLSTIVERVRNRFYRRLESLKQDIRYIAINARLFNQPNSEIVRNSRVLVETLIRYLNDAQYTDAMQLFHVLKAGRDSELKEYSNVKQCKVAVEEIKEEPSKSAKKTKRRSRTAMSPNPSMDHQSEWFTECAEVLQEVMSERTSSHFISPGSEWLADVFLIYDDLLAVKEKILTRTYNNPLEVVNAVKTLMQACRNSIDNKRSPVFRDSLTCAASFDNKMAPVVAKWQRMRQSESAPAMTNENEGHRLRARPRNSHVYNTRSRHDDRQLGDVENASTSASVPLRSGRSGRMPNGYYRELNNGTYMGEEQDTSNPQPSPSTNNNQGFGRAKRNGVDRVQTKSRGKHENGYVQAEDQPGPSGLQNRTSATNLRRSSRRAEKHPHFGSVALEDDSDEGTVKDEKVSSDEGSSESDDDPVSDCSWNLRTNGTKRSKSHRKKPCGSQEGTETNSKRRRQTVLKKCASDLSSASNSFSEQDSRTTRACKTRNRDLEKHSNHSAAAAAAGGASASAVAAAASATTCNNHARVRLRRSVQRNVNYNEDAYSDGGEASNSSARPAKRRRKNDG